jgi:hypothetical protein
MGIIQTFAEQRMLPFHRALFYMMNGIAAYKATTSTEEQVSIIRGKLR